MVDVSTALALRRAVDEDLPLPQFGDGVSVVHRFDGALNHVRVDLDAPLEIQALSAHFGPAQELPRPNHGGRVAAFPDTGPFDGQRTVTVLAELDRDGRVASLVLRPDDLTG